LSNSDFSHLFLFHLPDADTPDALHKWSAFQTAGRAFSDTRIVKLSRCPRVILPPPRPLASPPSRECPIPTFRGCPTPPAAGPIRFAARCTTSPVVRPRLSSGDVPRTERHIFRRPEGS
jgi:hypothetical protein